MRIEVYLESYNPAKPMWEQNVKMISEDDKIRVIIEFGEELLIFMADDLRAAIDACCGPEK